MKQGPEEKTVLQDVPWEDEPPVLEPGHDFDSVTDKITDAVLKRPIGLGWLAGLAAGMGLLGILLIAVTYLFLRGRRHLGHRDTRRPGASRSSTSCGGSVSATRER